ncbi:MAG TPA: hypothetical protein VK674_06615 [Candidatus Limnocylindria bacterium]|nr:hypothetical protein [Candidatus Limnocylindria bacterium]
MLLFTGGSEKEKAAETHGRDDRGIGRGRLVAAGLVMACGGVLGFIEGVGQAIDASHQLEERQPGRQSLIRAIGTNCAKVLENAVTDDGPAALDMSGEIANTLDSHPDDCPPADEVSPDLLDGGATYYNADASRGDAFVLCVISGISIIAGTGTTAYGLRRQ